MTDPSELDEATKARIAAEEKYRSELRSGQPATSTSSPPAKKKRGCGFWLLSGVGVVIALGVLAQIISPNSEPKSSPSTAASGKSTTPVTPATPAKNDVPSPASAPASATNVNADGSQDIGVWRVSMNNVSATRQVGGDFGEKAGDGETFILVNYTMQNTTKKTQNYSSMFDQPHLALTDGSIIDSDTMLGITADGQVVDGQIAPGLKRKGVAAFRVPTASLKNDFKFYMEFAGGEKVEWPIKGQ